MYLVQISSKPVQDNVQWEIFAVVVQLLLRKHYAGLKFHGCVCTRSIVVYANAMR